MFKLEHPIQVIGSELRTSNDDGRSFKEIPPFWEQFMKENRISKISNKLNDDIYIVYTHFENEGKNNQGMYSMIIGCQVKSNTVAPSGFTSVTIPADTYRVFQVEKGRPDKVGEVWQSIWAIPQSEKTNWRFSCEFERYQVSGEIDIFIGVNNKNSTMGRVGLEPTTY